MCKYCEGGQAIAIEEKGIGFDPTAEIDGDRITIGYWAQDCHGQDQHNAASITASYCPLCGKKLGGHAEVEACGNFTSPHWADAMPMIMRTEDADGTATYRSETEALVDTPGCSCNALRQAREDASAKGREIARLDAEVERCRAEAIKGECWKLNALGRCQCLCNPAVDGYCDAARGGDAS